MVEKRACRVCAARLPATGATGRLRQYCAVRCRRRMEYRRRRWDRISDWVRACAMNSAWEGLTPAQREAHRRRGEELRRTAGPRP